MVGIILGWSNGVRLAQIMFACLIVVEINVRCYVAASAAHARHEVELLNTRGLGLGKAAGGVVQLSDKKRRTQSKIDPKNMTKKYDQGI